MMKHGKEAPREAGLLQHLAERVSDMEASTCEIRAEMDMLTATAGTKDAFRMADIHHLLARVSALEAQLAAPFKIKELPAEQDSVCFDGLRAKLKAAVDQSIADFCLTFADRERTREQLLRSDQASR